MIRADASFGMGSGHVMRTSAIAEELISRGEEVFFVGDVTGLLWVSQRLKSLGFSRILTPTDGFKPDKKSDILILDSYTIPTNDFFILKDRWKRIVSIADDLTPKYSCDLIIRPGLEEDRNSDASNVLSGPRFIPLRSSIKKSNIVFKVGDTPKILIVGGGSDPFDFVRVVGNALQDSNLKFKSFLFSANISRYEFDSRFQVIPIGMELDQYASRANLVVTTASTTCLEFIGREIAVGIGCAAENQASYYDSLSRLGVAAPIGKYKSGYWEIDTILLSHLVESENFRRSLQNTTKNIIDLKGAERIVDQIRLLL